MSGGTVLTGVRRTRAKWRQILLLATLVVGCSHIDLPTPTKLNFTVQPSGAKVNASIGEVDVEELTADNARFIKSGTQVDIALGTNTTGATLGGTTRAFMVDGLTGFTALTVDKPGTYTLVATAAGLTAATSASFTITP